MSTLPNEVVDAILEHVDAVEQTMVDILPVGAWEARAAARSALEAAILAYGEEARREGIEAGAWVSVPGSGCDGVFRCGWCGAMRCGTVPKCRHHGDGSHFPSCHLASASPSPAEEARREAERLRRALRSVLDSHADCDDGSGTICPACAIAMAELSALTSPSSPVEGDGARGPIPKIPLSLDELGASYIATLREMGATPSLLAAAEMAVAEMKRTAAPSEPESGGTTPVPGPKGGPRGTFPGDLDRMPSGHTRHCEARMEWGDGECECGVLTTPTTVEGGSKLAANSAEGDGARCSCRMPVTLTPPLRFALPDPNCSVHSRSRPAPVTPEER